MERVPALADTQTGEIARRVARGRWASIAAEFGMLTGPEVDNRVGTASPPAGCLAAQRQILGVVTRAGRVLYPGFQFDPVTGQVRPMIARVAAVGLTGGWKDRHLLQWLCSPNGYLAGDRPVDVLDDPTRLMFAAHSDLDRVW